MIEMLKRNSEALELLRQAPDRGEPWNRVVEIAQANGRHQQVECDEGIRVLSGPEAPRRQEPLAP